MTNLVPGDMDQMRNWDPKAWNLMTPVKSFINRDNELQELKDLLKYNKNVVVTGPVGVGKSEIARKYCESFLSEYDRVIWIDGEDIEGNIFLLLKDLNILLPDDLQSSTSIQNAMSDAFEKLSVETTLIVYDNIEMNETLFKFLPKLGGFAYTSIRILMTSQDPRWPSHIISYPLLPLKLINAFTYLVYNIYDDGSINQKDIKQFLEKVVGRHPLLCQLSAAYVKKHQITVRQYKEILEEGIELLNGKTPTTKDSKFATPIHAAVNIAIKALEKNNSSTVVHLLNMLSFMDVNNMETKLLRFFKGDKGAYPEQLLTKLEEYSLISVRSPAEDSNEVSFTMYSFIRKVLQCNMNDATTTKCVQDISSMVRDSRTAGIRHLVPLIKRFAASNDILQILKIHKNTLRLALENDGRHVVAKEVVGCFFMHELKYEFKAGESFMNKYKYGRALEVFEDVLRNQSNHLGELHPDTLKTKKAIEDCKRKSRILGDDE